MQVFNALAALAPEAAAGDRERVAESVRPPAPEVVETPEITTAEAPEPATPEPEPEAELAPGSAAIEVPPAESQSIESQPAMEAAEPLPESVIETDGDVATIDRADEKTVVEIVESPDTAAAIEPESPEPAAIAEAVPGTETDTAQEETGSLTEPDNPFIQPAASEPPADPRRRGFVVAGIVLAVMLAGQAVFFYRSEVAARHPLARQWLASICAQAGCTLALPQRPQLILIEASDLQVTDPANPNRIQLTATLRNHAGHDVAYPALDLVLTNVNDHTLARRIFLPQDYLGTTRDVRAGIAANAELTVRLALETGNLGAAGFRLAVLSAPEP